MNVQIEQPAQKEREMSNRPCPKCSTLVAANQRFCSNCGAGMDVAQPSFQAPIPTAPPPPNYPPSPQGNQQMPSYGQPQQNPSYAQAQPQQNNTRGAFAALAALFLLRRGRRRSGGGLCGVIAGLLVLAILVGVGFAIFKSIGPSLGRTNTSGGTNTGNGSLTTQPPITTIPINGKVSYVGINITIINAQQSLAFLDDSASSQDGMVRVNLGETGSSSVGGFGWGDTARLILPNKTIVAPVNEQHAINPDAGTTRMNWLDFPVARSISLNQLTLQIGQPNQAQVVVPLTGKADLTQYQQKTVNPNVTTQYAGLTWTITSATLALSAGSQQADKGMRFVTLILKVDNSSSNDFSGFDGDYIRLTAGSTTSSPTSDSNFPTGFSANSTGTTGTLIFAVPEGNTSYTLMLLNTSSTPFTQATAAFQVA